MKIVDEYFGCDVFSTSAMQRYLPHAVYKQMMDVMEKGKVVEVGNHDELINKKGYYYRLWAGQSLEELSEAVVTKAENNSMCINSLIGGTN